MSDTSSVGSVPLQIRQARRADLADIARIHATAALEGYRSIFPPTAPRPTAGSLLSEWEPLVADPSVVILVATAPHPVGAVVVRDDADVPRGVLLELLYVDPRWWGRGVGAQLHDAALAAAAARGAVGVNLWVLELNDRARSMYERRGWVLVPDRTLTYDVGVVEMMYDRALRED